MRLHLLLAPLACLLLARTALAGQCMVSGDYLSQAYFALPCDQSFLSSSGDCVITGTVNGEWNDDW